MQILSRLKILSTLAGIVLAACTDQPLNNPYRDTERIDNTFYSSFAEQPKTLDPARSYSSNEYALIRLIYDPPLQYSYLKWPYQLESATLRKMPVIHYVDKEGNHLAENAPIEHIAYTHYDLYLRNDILFQPHPAFAKNEAGEYYYHHLNEDTLEGIEDIADFALIGTRRLNAHDYAYQIKRLAHPALQSPIFGLMEHYIEELDDLSKTLVADHEASSKNSQYIDLRKYSFAGVIVFDDYHYRITIKGKYPQFLYWLAMPFFAPLPWEADVFYSQPGMKEKNITLDWFPVGTGPFLLTENNPNREMVLERNPNYRYDYYPEVTNEEDILLGLNLYEGQLIPFLDKIVFSLEKEAIPRWTEFLQGYYDTSSISSDSYDQAVFIDYLGNAQLTEEMKKQNVRLIADIEPTIFYLSFNMLDDVVGGDSERARKLRQAISIAVDFDEFIALFLNGRGIIAQGPLPPGIFGYLEGEAGIDTTIFQWKNGRAERLPISHAKRLLEEAGYPEGIDPKTGEALIINYDVTAGSGPDDKARLDWMRKQFAKINIRLNVRATDYNRFQDKMRTGNAQMFSWGWHADYPDPENFLFLFSSRNSMVQSGGENAANYSNPEFDTLFAQMKNMENTTERQAIISKMIEILQIDSPWVWGYHPLTLQLAHQWVGPYKNNTISNDGLKYRSIDPNLRSQLRDTWNTPVWWPLWLVVVTLLLIIFPMLREYQKREKANV